MAGIQNQFILLPRSGFFSNSGPAAASLQSLPVVASLADAQQASIGTINLRVLDTLAEKGPKLVEMSAQAAEQCNAPTSPLRALPLVVYDHPRLPIFPSSGQPLPAAAAPPITIRCRETVSGTPIVGARVVAFYDFANRWGSQGFTNGNGEVLLSFPTAVPIERLYVESKLTHWGAFRQNLPYANVLVDVEPVDLTVTDCVRHYLPAAGAGARFDPATGVLVGVLDTGVGPHGDLNLEGGVCTVTGQPAHSFQDVGVHGTHVAGLIGAQGTLTGLAPGVRLRAYRVFPDAVTGATNYAILKAMILAASDVLRHSEPESGRRPRGSDRRRSGARRPRQRHIGRHRSG